MNWEPISVAELRRILDEQITQFDPATAEVWARYSIEPEPIPCIRKPLDESPPEPEPIFAVAQAGDCVLVYDDVEDEFGVGLLDEHGILQMWSIYGDQLVWPIRNFPQPVPA